MLVGHGQEVTPSPAADRINVRNLQKKTGVRRKIFPIVDSPDTVEVGEKSECTTSMGPSLLLLLRNSMLKFTSFRLSRRTVSGSDAKKTVTFNSCVGIAEFHRAESKYRGDLWYTGAELEGFRSDAAALVLKQRRKHQAAAVQPPQVQVAATYSSEQQVEREIEREIRSILVVESNDFLRTLFVRYIKSILGEHVNVAVARSAKDASRKIAAAQGSFPQFSGGPTHGFDVIICEERLKRPTNNFSGRLVEQGSSLLGRIRAEQDAAKAEFAALPWWVVWKPRPRLSLLVGMSAHIAYDRERLEESGADLIWSKPPPPISERPQVEMLRAITEKRGGVSR